MELLPATTSPTTATAQSRPAITSDFETFLKMLTTQLRNQDPLNPMDSADYAVQLATFSGVEQAVRTNQLLESMQTQFEVLSMSQLAGWVGQEARAEAPVYSDGSAVHLVLPAVPAADRAVLVVRDADGRVVARDDVSIGGGDFTWHGMGADGSALATGHYALSVEGYLDDVLQQSTAVQHYAQIIEARGGREGTRLVLRGGGEVSAADVLALRVP